MTADDKHPTRFKPGQSGNPAGRPQGSRNKASLVLDCLEEGQYQAVVRSQAARALNGSDRAAETIIRAVSPRAKERMVTLDLPATDTPQGVADAYGFLIQQVARGDISPEQAGSVSQILDAQRRAIESAELERRIGALEAAAGLAPA